MHFRNLTPLTLLFFALSLLGSPSSSRGQFPEERPDRSTTEWPRSATRNASQVTPPSLSEPASDFRAAWEARIKQWRNSEILEGVVTNSRLTFGSRQIIRGRVQGNVISLGNSVAVLGEVDGSVTVVGGDAIILGPVRGDVSVFGGNLQVDAPISGKALSMGSVQSGPNARFDGAPTEWGWDSGFSQANPDSDFHSRSGDLGSGIARILWPTSIGARVLISLWHLCISMIVAACFPLRVMRAAETVRASPFRCGLFGLLWSGGFWLAVIGSLFLCIFLIGIPILAVLVLVNFLIRAFGITVVAYCVGCSLLKIEGECDRPWRIVVPVGILLLCCLSSAHLFGTLLWWIAAWVGVGATLLSRKPPPSDQPPSPRNRQPLDWGPPAEFPRRQD